MTITRRTLAISLASLFVVAAAAIVLVLARGGGDEAGAPKTFTLTGTMYVANCASAGYSDVLPGAQVQVSAQGGEVLAVGTLQRSFEVSPTQVLTASDFKAICTSKFSIPNVPTAKNLYGIHIGNGNRGVIWKSEAEAKLSVDLNIS
jgi:hypothetical protein